MKTAPKTPVGQPPLWQGLDATFLKRRKFLLIALVMVCVISFSMGHGSHIDFNVTFAGGVAVHHGHTYLNANEIGRIHKMLHLGYSRKLAGVPYGPPPLIALVFLPLSMLQYSNAFLLFMCFVIACWLVLFFAISPESRIPLAMISVVSMPAISGFYTGNISIVVGPLFLLSFIAIQKGRFRTAAIVLGVTAALKLFPLALFGVFLFKRKWRETAWGVGVVALSYVLTLAVLGVHRFGEIIRFTIKIANSIPIFSPNDSLPGFVKYQTNNAAVGSLIATIATLGFLFLLFRLRSLPFDRYFAVMGTLLIFCQRQSWDHYYFFAFPMILLMWQKRRSLSRPLFLIAALGALLIIDIRGVIFLLSGEKLNALVEHLSSGILIEPQVLGAVILLPLAIYLFRATEPENVESRVRSLEQTSS